MPSQHRLCSVCNTTQRHSAFVETVAEGVSLVWSRCIGDELTYAAQLWHRFILALDSSFFQRNQYMLVQQGAACFVAGCDKIVLNCLKLHGA